jgi:hypothetical protein
MTEAKPKKRRTWFWWLAAITAPLGILGGPIAIAEMFAGTIKWHGPAGFLVAFWDEKVSAPFHAVFAWMAGLIGVPPFKEFYVDYFVVSLLAAGTFFRALTMWDVFAESSFNPSWKLTLLLFAAAIFFWPVIYASVLLLFVVTAPMAMFDWRASADMRRELWSLGTLILAPFLLFMILFLANVLLFSPSDAAQVGGKA